MNTLHEYVLAHTERGECVCGRCIDALADPEKKQPSGHTVDLVFFKLSAIHSPRRERFLELVRMHHARWLDGEEHSYIEMGGDMGDQGIALQTMGLGALLNVWVLLTPKTVIPLISDERARHMAGLGFVTVKRTVDLPVQKL